MTLPPTSLPRALGPTVAARRNHPPLLPLPPRAASGPGLACSTQQRHFEDLRSETFCRYACFNQRALPWTSSHHLDKQPSLGPAALTWTSRLALDQQPSLGQAAITWTSSHHLDKQPCLGQAAIAGKAIGKNTGQQSARRRG